MPKIIGLEAQQQAVREIQGLMKDITNVNHFLQNANPAGEYQISFIGPEGRKISTTFTCANKEWIDHLLQEYKTSVAAAVSQKTEEYRIALDEQEKGVFGL